MTDALQDRVRGVLYGLAAGDKIGGPVRMALKLAHSLADTGTFDPDDIFRRYLAWWHDDGYDSGPTSAHVFDLAAGGMPRDEAVKFVHISAGGLTAGCNPLHRTPPLAMAAFLPDADLPALARTETALTHYDPLAGDMTASSVALCRALIRGADYYETLITTLPKIVSERFYSNRKFEYLNRGGYAPDVMLAAVEFTGEKTFVESLTRALKFAGGANYCPVLVGALAGARFGKNAIPPDMLSHCADILPEIDTVAEQLAQSWIS